MIGEGGGWEGKAPAARLGVGTPPLSNLDLIECALENAELL